MNIAIITGASSGIGEEFARQIDQYYKGIDEIWLIARRKERLEKLQKTLGTPSRVMVLDLSDASSLSIVRDHLQSTESPKISVLVNAAGFGVLGNVEESDPENEARMLDVNVKSLTVMTNICEPYLQRNSIVFQIASAAAFLPQPGFAVYAASKAYVLSYTMALREELRKKGVRVIAVCPGPVATEFFDAAVGKSELGKFKNRFMVKKEKVVHLAMKDAREGKAVSACGISMKCFRILAKILPHSFLLRQISRISSPQKSGNVLY